MKKYFLTLFILWFTITLSSFVKHPTKEATPVFCKYVYKYIGAATCTQAQVENRDNWRVRILNPFTECVTGATEDLPCSFTTNCNGAYITSIGIDFYKPSTAIAIIAKPSDSCPGKYVVDYVILVSDGSTVSDSVQNIEGCGQRRVESF